MQYITGTREFHIDDFTVVTLGKFDGLHRGHKKLLDEMSHFREKGYKTAVFTFETTPGTLMNGKLQTMITTNAERKVNLEQAGIDYLVEYPFNQEVAHMMPEDFVAHILVGQMKAKAIVAGSDFHFGYKRSGDVNLLEQLSSQYGYEMVIVEKAMDEEREISSTYIREELAKGNIKKVNELLGYTYMIHGEVVHGRHLGTKLGFPTVNLLPREQKHLPAFGVYLSTIVIDGKTYNSITNIGRKPTIDGERPAGVETYIYGMNEDLYGKWIEVRLLEFIRPEEKFADVEMLKRQVTADKETGYRMHQERASESSSKKD
ncbi:MAG: bifunctional riboflavin kinase/FAD synthetase [Clostridium sp.]